MFFMRLFTFRKLNLINQSYFISNRFFCKSFLNYIDQIEKLKSQLNLVEIKDNKINQLIYELSKITAEINEIENLSIQQNEENFKLLINDELKSIDKNVNKLKYEVLDLIINGNFNNVSELHMEFESGTGGLEAMIFNKELINFYINFAKSLNFKVDIFDVITISGNSIKNAVLKINGENCFRLLQNEAGVHRVQRVPETDRLKRIHTSAIGIKVIPIFKEKELELDKKFIKIETMRSSGPGGQNVNKTETCVRVVHLPTGIDIKCQDTREQSQNKQLALNKLQIKLSNLKYEKLINFENKLRQSQVKNIEPSEKVRTFNYLQDRIKDHRLKKELFNLKAFFNGEFNDILFEWIKDIDKLNSLNQYNDLCRNLNL